MHGSCGLICDCDLRLSKLRVKELRKADETKGETILCGNGSRLTVGKLSITRNGSTRLIPCQVLLSLGITLER